MIFAGGERLLIMSVILHISESVCSHSSCSYCGSVDSLTGSDESAVAAVKQDGEANQRDGEGNTQEKSAARQPDILETVAEMKKPSTLKNMGLLILPSNSGCPSSAGPLRTPFHGTSHQRMFIPKPQLTVSHRSSSSSMGAAAAVRQRHHGSQSERKLLLPPSASIAATSNSSSNYDRNVRGIDLDDFAHEYVPKTASKRVLQPLPLNMVDSHLDPEVADYQQQIAKGMRNEYVQGLRSGGEHMVIDIFPKPPRSDIDQTLGIPIVGQVPYDVPGVPKMNLPRQSLHLNPLNAMHQHQLPQKSALYKTERPLQVVHQYPLVSGQIPPANGVGAAATNDMQSNKFSSKLLMALRPYQESPPVAQPNAMTAARGSNSSSGSGRGAGTSSNSSKSSGEKNKVKFSETIQVAVLPEIPRKEKPMMTMKGPRVGGTASGVTAGAPALKSIMFTDPRRELADSLPLCHPNEDYLKDFQPAAALENGEIS